MSDTREVSAGPTERFPVGELTLTKVGGRELGILRRDDDTVHAVRNWCPHKGAPICKVQPTGTAIPGPPGTLTKLMVPTEGRKLLKGSSVATRHSRAHPRGSTWW